MKKERVTLTIDADVRTQLDRTGNASDYITRAIRERLDAVEAALRTLRLDGWRSSELLAAANALTGFEFARFGSDGRLVAAELERSAIERQVSGDDLANWRMRIESVRNDPTTSHALCVVIGELRLGNEAVVKSVGAMLGALRVVACVQYVDVPLDVQIVDVNGNVVAGPYSLRRGQRVDLGCEPPMYPVRVEDYHARLTRFRFAIDGELKWSLELDPEERSIPWFQYEFFVK